MEQTERDLMEQARLNTREEFIAWEHLCDVFIESLDAQSHVKRPIIDWCETIFSRTYRATRKFGRFGARTCKWVPDTAQD